MKIKTKLFLSLIFIAILSMVISLNFSILSISKRYEKMAKEEIAAAKKVAESVFLENLGDLVRKALFLSELKEIIENTDNQDELAMALEFKSFFFSNINIKILDPAERIVLIHDNSSVSHITEKNLDKITFLNKKRDPLIREAGVFLIDDSLCMAAISPIIDQETFGLKGFLMLEIPFNLEFTDQIKEKSKTDIMVYVLGRPLTSTLTDSNGEMIFPRLAKANPDEMIRFQPGGDRYLLDVFNVEDFHKQKVGEIFVAVNIEKIMAAKKVGISSLLTVSLLIGFFVILTSILLGKKLTSPIVNLAQGAEAIAGGNYDIRMKLESKDEIGELANVFNKMTDSLKIQRDEIRELQQFFAKIVEHSPSAIVIGNESTEVIAMNPAAEKLLQMPLSMLKDKQFFECQPLFKPLKEDYFKVLLSGNPCFYDNFSVVHEQGGEKILRLTLYKIPLPGAPAEVLQMEDISEKFELEEKLLHAKKLGTLGELLSRFTHEFNNLMTSLLGHLSILKKEMGTGHPNFKRTLLIEDVALRAHNLGKDILDFSKKEKLKKESMNVRDAIETVLNLLGKTVLKSIEVEKYFADSSLTVLMNKEKFLLALFNVLINAKDTIWTAQREKGLIGITVDRIFISKAENNFVRIKISDNGTGIDERIINKIFEPYFTTKGEKGTGLGLTTVKETIEENSGWIEIDVKKGKGTTFILFLPEHGA
ncbi:MAG: HAMP domain-containing protein [Acidobacteria bacterium]|nr:HAMP domain-containing protein [Acidobacteriota bacterium]MBU4307730.1 HAMP domain-containing protein [Acidobacteriota bacterium]MCG2810043.1 ATP-binding protein [Candidatus Aminicenantes bacterium]